jgi:hypothetical protein
MTTNSYTVNFTTGAIRYASGSTSDSVLDLHVWLADRSDDADGKRKDVPSKLAGIRDPFVPAMVILLNSGPRGVEYNIDDTTSHYLYFGSISQEGGDTLYTGIHTSGPIVSASPMYIVQNGSKVSAWWGGGHVRTLIKVKTEGVFIDSGIVTIFSRKYGQTGSHSDANLSPGSEQFVAISTEIDSLVSATEAQAAVLLTGMGTTVGTVSHDLGNGNGAKNYDAEFDTNGKNAQEIYDAAMWLISENSTASIDSTPGWRFRSLNGVYVENPKRPIVTLTAGVLYFERGWFPTNVAINVKYSLIASDGTVQEPITATIEFQGLTAGSEVRVYEQPHGQVWKVDFDGVIVSALNETIIEFHIQGNPDPANHYFWFNYDYTGNDPAPGGTGHEVTIAVDDNTSDVATSLQTVAETITGFSAVVDGTVVTVTNNINGELSEPTTDSDSKLTLIRVGGISTDEIDGIESSTGTSWVANYNIIRPRRALIVIGSAYTEIIQYFVDLTKAGFVVPAAAMQRDDNIR